MTALFGHALLCPLCVACQYYFSTLGKLALPKDSNSRNKFLKGLFLKFKNKKVQKEKKNPRTHPCPITGLSLLFLSALLLLSLGTRQLYLSIEWLVRCSHPSMFLVCSSLQQLKLETPRQLRLSYLAIHLWSLTTKKDACIIIHECSINLSLNELSFQPDKWSHRLGSGSTIDSKIKAPVVALYEAYKTHELNSHS